MARVVLMQQRVYCNHSFAFNWALVKDKEVGSRVTSTSPPVEDLKNRCADCENVTCCSLISIVFLLRLLSGLLSHEVISERVDAIFPHCFDSTTVTYYVCVPRKKRARKSVTGP